MQRATPLLSKLGKIYKIKPHFDTVKNWEQALEDLRDVEIERDFGRLIKYISVDFKLTQARIGSN